jgi:hypothetical protein
MRPNIVLDINRRQLLRRLKVILGAPVILLARDASADGGINGRWIDASQAAIHNQVPPEQEGAKVNGRGSGPIGDGIADDTAAIAAAFDSESVPLFRRSLVHKIRALDIGKKSALVWARLFGAEAQLVVTQPASVDVVMLYSEIENKKKGGIGFHQNSLSNTRLSIVGSRIVSEGYAFLSNKKAKSLRDVVIAFSRIESNEADAICLNHPGDADARRVITAFNSLRAGGGENNISGATAGFGFSVAGTKGHITVGNTVEAARKEAFHIEDAQERGIVSLNIAESCIEDGVHVIAGQSSGEPLVIIGNHLRHTGKKTGFFGFQAVDDKNGTVGPNAVIGNVFKGFGGGLRAGSLRTQHASGTIILECDYGVTASAGAAIQGENITRDTPILARGGAGSIIDTVWSEDAPAKILERTGGGSCGSMLKEWQGRWVLKHDGGGNQVFGLFDLPTLAKGELSISATDGVTGKNGFFMTAEITWSNQQLSIENVLKDSPGDSSNIAWLGLNGKLAIRFGATSPRVLNAIVYFGPGRWYVN